MHDVKGEDVNGEQREGQGEQVEVAVVPLAHTVPHPRTVVIKPVCDTNSRTQTNVTSQEMRHFWK